MKEQNQMTDSELVAEKLSWNDADVVFTTVIDVTLGDDTWTIPEIEVSRLSAENSTSLVRSIKNSTSKSVMQFIQSLPKLALILPHELGFHLSPLRIVFKQNFLADGRMITNQKELETWLKELEALPQHP